MTGATPSPLVRRGFLKWSVAIFVLLLPLVLHAVWDYAETRRLSASVAAIRKSHEPVTAQDIHPYRALTGDTARADAYYRAAAALSVDANAPPRADLASRLADATDRDVWPNDLMADLRSRVARGEEALDMLDRATPLPFDGFVPGTAYSFLATDMLRLARLAAMRTRLRALEGDGRAALDSLYSELRLPRTLDEAPNAFVVPRFAVAGIHASLGLLVTHAQLDATALPTIAAALREMDRDDRLKRAFLLERAALLNSGSVRGSSALTVGAVRALGLWDSLSRPWLMRMVSQRLETLAVLIDGAGRPWPARLDPPPSAYIFHTATERGFEERDAARAGNVAIDLALIRCARVVVAVEQYRFAQSRALPSRVEDVIPGYLDAMPVDPFSGRPLRFVVKDGGYVVYSLGPNRRDDGGTPHLAGSPQPATDLGIRIAHR